MVARVKGPTDHVVVVGAGLAGLSAAMRLAGASLESHPVGFRSWMYRTSLSA
jgi:uncharacterized protein with NAD-binding domain and iron-sulfur cluster